MVIWIIGLSGAGKSTLALEVANRARHSISNVVLLDGDMVREVWGSDLGHDLKDRKKNAERLCRLCKLLDSQGIHVVCAVLSLFEESREWNREHLSDYFEVYIKASLKDLKDLTLCCPTWLSAITVTAKNCSLMRPTLPKSSLSHKRKKNCVSLIATTTTSNTGQGAGPTFRLTNP